MGIGTTGMLPALVILDEYDPPQRPSIQLTDTRAQKEIEEIKAQRPEGYFLIKTGAILRQQSIGPKLLWIQRNEPQSWQHKKRKTSTPT